VSCAWKNNELAAGMKEGALLQLLLWLCVALTRIGPSFSSTATGNNSTGPIPVFQIVRREGAAGVTDEDTADDVRYRYSSYFYSTYTADADDGAVTNIGNGCRSSAVILGVGTAQTVDDYDALARALTTELEPLETLVVVIDPVPHDPIKLYPGPFAKAVNHLVAQLQQKQQKPEISSEMRLCPDQDATIVVGGHSASGAAAFSADFDFTVTGFLGLDPFPIFADGVDDPFGAAIHTRHHRLSVPALHWGFSHSTCGVGVSRAALAAYEQSPTGQRVFFQIQNDDDDSNNNNDNEPSDDCHYSHCAFTDAGCWIVCPLRCSEEATRNLRHDVALSVRLFLQALEKGEHKFFARREFESGAFQLDPRQVVLLLDEERGSVVKDSF